MTSELGNEFLNRDAKFEICSQQALNSMGGLHDRTLSQRHVGLRSYKEYREDWFNAAYLSLMKEKGADVQSRLKAIVASD
jgi:hypothetical protein